jgi:hypothetical protein
MTHLIRGILQTHKVQKSCNKIVVFCISFAHKFYSLATGINSSPGIINPKQKPPFPFPVVALTCEMEWSEKNVSTPIDYRLLKVRVHAGINYLKNRRKNDANLLTIGIRPARHKNLFHKTRNKSK